MLAVHFWVLFLVLKALNVNDHGKEKVLEPHWFNTQMAQSQEGKDINTHMYIKSTSSCYINHIYIPFALI